MSDTNPSEANQYLESYIQGMTKTIEESFPNANKETLGGEEYSAQEAYDPETQNPLETMETGETEPSIPEHVPLEPFRLSFAPRSPKRRINQVREVSEVKKMRQEIDDLKQKLSAFQAGDFRREYKLPRTISVLLDQLKRGKDNEHIIICRYMILGCMVMKKFTIVEYNCIVDRLRYPEAFFEVTKHLELWRWGNIRWTLEKMLDWFFGTDFENEPFREAISYYLTQGKHSTKEIKEEYKRLFEKNI